MKTHGPLETIGVEVRRLGAQTGRQALQNARSCVIVQWEAVQPLAHVWFQMRATPLFSLVLPPSFSGSSPICTARQAYGAVAAQSSANTIKYIYATVIAHVLTESDSQPFSQR
jgi:hypothetical protein